MAENSDGQDKIFDATPKRIEDAKKEGQVLTSKEVFVLSSMVSMIFMGLFIYINSDQVILKFADYFSWSDKIENVVLIGYLRDFEFVSFLLVLSVIVALPFVITLFTQLVIFREINFASKALHFKANRISLIQGFKRMFGIKALVELGKALAKVLFLLAVSAIIIYLSLDNIKVTPFMSLVDSIKSSSLLVLKLVGFLSIILAFIAIIDFIWQRHQWLEQLKMTSQEVRDELKQTEGSPEVRSRIRSMQRSIAESGREARAAIKDVPDARVIIRNPTHFAVALKYDETTPTPIIIAMGRGYLAQNIVDIGEKEGIQVVEHAFLARALFFSGQIGKEIASELYVAIAAVLAFVYRLERQEEVPFPDLEIPPEMIFDETGKNI
ncbi:MAG: EscU/YscU/HrcU family type III secretion system export apparatus switch protein [Rhodospirillaceae bacterium]